MNNYSIDDAIKDLDENFVVYGTGIIDVTFGECLNFDVNLTCDNTHGTSLYIDKKDADKACSILNNAINENQRIVCLGDIVFRFINQNDIYKLIDDIICWKNLGGKCVLIPHKR